MSIHYYKNSSNDRYTSRRISISMIVVLLISLSVFSNALNFYLKEFHIPIDISTFTQYLTLLSVIVAIFHLVFVIINFKRASIKKQIQKAFIDTSTINAKRFDTNVIEVPDIAVKRWKTGEFEVMVEQLPTMTDDTEKNKLFINASLKNWNKNLVVKDSYLDETMTQTTYILHDTRTIQAIKARKIEDLDTQSSIKYTIAKNVVWNITKSPHALVAGKTGSGKTTFLNSLLAQMFKNKASVEIIDPKSEFLAYDFMQDKIVNTPEAAVEALRTAIEALNERQGIILSKVKERGESGLSGADIGLTPYFIIIDELASLLAMMSKSQKDDFSKNLLQLILLGRSALVNVILTTQQANSKTISTDIRDNLGLRVLLGSASKEAQKMVFGDNELPGNVSNFAGYYEILGITNTPQFFRIADLRSGKLNQIKTLKRLYNLTQK